MKFFVKNFKQIMFAMLSIVVSMVFLCVFVNFSNSKSKSNTAFGADYITELKNQQTNPPISYNLQSYYPISAEDQTDSNLCWAYASCKVLETALLVQANEYHNFSEFAVAYLGYYSGYKSAINSNGIFQDFINISTTNGLVYEAEASNDLYYDVTTSNYQEYDYILNLKTTNVSSSIIPVNISDNSSYTGSVTRVKQQIIKNFIMKYGGVFAGIKAGVVYKDNGYVYTTNTEIEAEKYSIPTNHAVCIIGWDTRGFIALNSWGELISTFYIPYSDFDYQGLFGIVLQKDTITLSTNSSSTFASITKFNQLSNIYCLKDDISLGLNFDSSYDFSKIFISIFKGTQNVTSNFSLKFDDNQKKIDIDYKNDYDSFLGGMFIINIYSGSSMIAKKEFFIYSGTEITGFELIKTGLYDETDSNLLLNSYLGANKTVTYYLDSSNNYNLKFSLATMSNYKTISNKLNFNVSPVEVCSYNGYINTWQNTGYYFGYSNDLSSSISNEFTIKLSSLSSYTGKLVRFNININSKISSYTDVVSTYVVYIYVSEKSNVETANSYSISYHLNGGLNSNENITRYPIFSNETNAVDFVLKNPTKQNETFLGWYIDEDYVTKVTKITDGFVGDIHLYAKWQTPDSIEFDTNLNISSIVDYDKNEKLEENIVYGDSIKFSYTFDCGSDLNQYNYIVRYFIYINDKLFAESQIARNTSIIDFELLYPDLKCGSYNVRIATIIVGYNISQTQTNELSFSVAKRVVNYDYADVEITYNRQYYSPVVSNVEGVYQEDLQDFEIFVSNSVKNNAGIYEYSVTGVNNSNYQLSEYKTATLIINKAKLDVEWLVTEVDYNGQSQLPQYEINGILAGDSVSIFTSFDEMINAGSYNVSISDDKLSNGNYKLNTTSTIFKINPINIVVTLDNQIDRVQTLPENRKVVTYSISGTRYDSDESLGIKISTEAYQTNNYGEYLITAVVENTNYVAEIIDAKYTLTGFYYVYYTLPNGNIYIETIQSGENPNGITDEIYKKANFSVLRYSPKLENTGEDLHIEVTEQNYELVVFIGSIILGFLIVYWLITRKQRKNKVS